MDITSPKYREEVWTDIDFTFLSGCRQITLKPGDEYTDRPELPYILIHLNRHPFSVSRVYRHNLLMDEVTQRTVRIPINSTGQPLAPSTEEEEAPGSSE